MLSSNRGASMAEVLFSIVAVGISSLMLINSGALSIKKNSTIEEQNIRVISQNISKLLINDVSFQNTVNYINNKNLKCIRDNENCFKVKGPISVLDVDGTIVVDSLNPNSGFTRFGEPCNSFDPESDKPDCPFRVEVSWESICEGKCTQPVFRANINYTFNSYVQTKISNIKVANSNESLALNKNFLASPNPKLCDPTTIQGPAEDTLKYYTPAEGRSIAYVPKHDVLAIGYPSVNKIIFYHRENPTDCWDEIMVDERVDTPDDPTLSYWGGSLHAGEDYVIAFPKNQMRRYDTEYFFHFDVNGKTVTPKKVTIGVAQTRWMYASSTALNPRTNELFVNYVNDPGFNVVLRGAKGGGSYVWTKHSSVSDLRSKNVNQASSGSIIGDDVTVRYLNNNLFLAVEEFNFEDTVLSGPSLYTYDSNKRRSRPYGMYMTALNSGTDKYEYKHIFYPTYVPEVSKIVIGHQSFRDDALIRFLPSAIEITRYNADGTEVPAWNVWSAITGQPGSQTATDGKRIISYMDQGTQKVHILYGDNDTTWNLTDNQATIEADGVYSGLYPLFLEIARDQLFIYYGDFSRTKPSKIRVIDLKVVAPGTT